MDGRAWILARRTADNPQHCWGMYSIDCWPAAYRLIACPVVFALKPVLGPAASDVDLGEVLAHGRPAREIACHFLHKDLQIGYVVVCGSLAATPSA